MAFLMLAVKRARERRRRGRSGLLLPGPPSVGEEDSHGGQGNKEEGLWPHPQMTPVTVRRLKMLRRYGIIML